MKRLALLALVACLASCAKVIDIDPDQSERKVVVMATATEGEDIALRVTLSRFFLDTHPFTQVADARLELTVNGQKRPAMVENNGGSYLLHYAPQAGDSLELAVSVPGREPVRAATTVPALPVVSNLRMEEKASGATRMCNIRFTLSDDAATNNYYAISLRYCGILYRERFFPRDSVTLLDTIVLDEELWLSTNDPALNDLTSAESMMFDYIDDNEWGELVFSDAAFNGRSYEVRISADITYAASGVSRFDNDYSPDHGYANVSITEGPAAVRMQLRSLSRDMYLFELSDYAYDDDEVLAFFSEPVQVHSNIAGGIGLFAGQSVMEAEFSAGQAGRVVRAGNDHGEPRAWRQRRGSGESPERVHARR